MLQLFRIESERLELPAPFGRSIAKALDADAPGQATFYSCFDKIGCEEGERDGHVDLPNAAFLSGAELCDGSHPTRGYVIQPPAAARDCTDQARPALKLLRTGVASRCIVRDEYSARPFGGRLLPGNCERAIIRRVGCFARLI